jgi:hypothetical protein
MAVTKTNEARQEELYVVLWHKYGYKVPMKLNVTVFTTGAELWTYIWKILLFKIFLM